MNKERLLQECLKRQAELITIETIKIIDEVFKKYKIHDEDLFYQISILMIETRGREKNKRRQARLKPLSPIPKSHPLIKNKLWYQNSSMA